MNHIDIKKGTAMHNISRAIPKRTHENIASQSQKGIRIIETDNQNIKLAASFKNDGNESGHPPTSSWLNSYGENRTVTLQSYQSYTRNPIFLLVSKIFYF